MSDRHYSTDGPICPHCSHLHRPDDPFFYDEGTTEMQCEACDVEFPVNVYTSTSWTTSKFVEEL